MADLWNSRRFRSGDSVRRFLQSRADSSKEKSKAKRQWQHANTWTVQGFLRLAFQSVGSTVRAAKRGQRHETYLFQILVCSFSLPGPSGPFGPVFFFLGGGRARRAENKQGTDENLEWIGFISFQRAGWGLRDLGPSCVGKCICAYAARRGGVFLGIIR